MEAKQTERMEQFSLKRSVRSMGVKSFYSESTEQETGEQQKYKAGGSNDKGPCWMWIFLWLKEELTVNCGETKLFNGVFRLLSTDKKELQRSESQSTVGCRVLAIHTADTHSVPRTP